MLSLVLRYPLHFLRYPFYFLTYFCSLFEAILESSCLTFLRLALVYWECPKSRTVVKITDTLYLWSWWVSLVAQTVKNLPAMQQIWVQSLIWEDPLKKGMVTHSNILAWRIPWTEEPGGLQSMGLWRVRHNWATNAVLVRLCSPPMWVSKLSCFLSTDEIYFLLSN